MDARVRRQHLLLRVCDFRSQAVRGHRRIVERFLSLNTGRPQCLCTTQFDLCVLQLHLQVEDAGLCGIAIRFRGRK